MPLVIIAEQRSVPTAGITVVIPIPAVALSALTPAPPAILAGTQALGVVMAISTSLPTPVVNATTGTPTSGLGISSLGTSPLGGS